NQPPHYISDQAKIVTSLINEGCLVSGDIEKSVLFQGVTVEEGAIVKEAVVMPNAVIEKNVYLERVIVPPNMIIPEGTVLAQKDNNKEVILVTEKMLEELYSH